MDENDAKVVKEVSKNEKNLDRIFYFSAGAIIVALINIIAIILKGM